MKVKMSFCPFVVYFLLIIVINVAVKSQMSSNSNSNAFIQNDDVRSYIVDSIPITMAKRLARLHDFFKNQNSKPKSTKLEDFSSNSARKAQNEEESTSSFSSQTHLKFQPTLLDFKERALGVPHLERVTIINLHKNKTVHMTSISGNTVHFHSSFFEDKIIPPLGNTSFNVVFLGREEGEVESNLFIHTSEGSFKYQVRGLSVQSPYRLRPLSNVRLPLNASFSPLIQMHNPYASALQLVEVYSSGGEFHLELPSGEMEGPRNMWEIPAFLTKPIIRVRFHARAQKNHTAYIRLKVNQSEEVLMVPLEVEVGAACGLYSPEDVLDFGIGGSNDPPTTLKLWLHNSWKKAIKIQNVISTPVSKALRIDFEPVKVPAETEKPTEVAQLTFDWAVALESGHTGGRVVVKSKQSGQKLVIPYTATVLAGGLTYDSQVTRFRSDSSHIPPRTFQLTNNFRLPIAITNVSLPSDALLHFELRQFEPRILEPGQTVSLFEIVATFRPHLTLDSTVVIFTNVSTLSVPLLCYNGKLTKVISHQNETELDLGTVGSGTEKQVLFALVNSNPVPVTLLSWDTTLSSITVTIAGIHNGNATSFLSDHLLNLDNETTQERSVGPGQYAVVRLVVRANTQAGEMSTQVKLRTEYETVAVNVYLRTEHGSLKVTPDPLLFKNCFPGKVCSEMLRVQSLFTVAMSLTAVSGDPRLGFSPISPPLLLPATTTALGTLSFDTGQLPPEANYLAVTHNVTGATRWQDTLELPAHCPDYDLSLLAARYNRYHSLSTHLLNLSLRLDTTEVKEHMFGANVQLVWPLLSSSLVFPLTQVGNTTRRTLVISNPGSHDHLMVQLVLENTYPSASSLVNSLPKSMKPETGTGGEAAAGEFVLDTSQSMYLQSGRHVHRDTWVFLLPPASNTSVLVNFTPVDARASSVVMLLRNNLTVLEVVQLSGTGAHAQFKFGNRKPGSTTPLLFELTDKHLKDCEREKQRKFPAPNLTVKRSFTARNTGAVSISVHGFDISGLACEGYGFRVLNCESFDLPPNGTRKVDIAFSPDFTLARVQRTLGVWTSESEDAANYTLVATLPPFLLGSCSSVLARPTWEPLLYYCAVTFMVFLLLCVLAAAFLESDRALKCALLAMSRDNATVQPVLDLKSIGTGVGFIPSSLMPTLRSETPSVSWSRAPPPPTPTPAASLESSEGVREKMFKLETENASVFTSSSSKCAKKKEKVSKRFSDPTDSVSTESRSTWANVFSKPVTVTKPTVHVKPVVSSPPVETQTCKQTFPEVKRKLCKKTTSSAVRCLLPTNSEDTETSSTTTESSHDDGDKEVEVMMELRDCESADTQDCESADMRDCESESVHMRDSEVVKREPVRVRACVAKSGEGKRTGAERERERLQGGSASSLELEWEDEEPQAKKSHATNPSATRTRKSNSSKCGKSSEAGVSGQTSSRGKSSGVSKQSNVRAKDKQPLTQKRSVEKQLSQPKPLVVEPPPPPVTVWDDTRASFSDVVARSDSTKHTSEQMTGPPLLQPPATPTAVVAPAPVPAPSTPTTLGPIGSKKTYPGWDCWSDSVCLSPAAPPLAPAPAPVTNSFFMDTRAPPLMQSTSSWKEHDLLLKIMQADEQRRLEAQELQRSRPVYQDTWSPWSGSAPTAEPSSLWGNDVWAPPPPPDTWAPPGLAPRPPPRLDDPTNSDLDIGMDYDPFRSLSNIWAPHTPHNNTNPFWKPPTSNN